jgi:hypothetical protein
VLNKLLFKDSSGKKSLTATVFVWGALVVNAKLVFSGMTLVSGMTLAPFTGGEYAAAMAALGAVYVMRRSTDPTAKREEGENG